MQRATGKPAPEGSVDRSSDSDQPFLAGEPGRGARIDSGQRPAEMVQRGLWAHGSLLCSCFVL